VLACDATLGYESTLGIKDSPVVAFNGEPVRNLAQVCAADRVYSTQYCGVGGYG
jgi:hypothetical protein